MAADIADCIHNFQWPCKFSKPKYPLFCGKSNPLFWALILARLGCDVYPGGVKGLGPTKLYTIIDNIHQMQLSATMVTWIIGEIDAMLPGALKVKKNPCELPCWKIGEPSFWHHGGQPKVLPSDRDLITCDMQASVLELQQVPLQGIHHMHSDLEGLSFQDFEEEIVLSNGSELPIKPCLPVVTSSLLGWHDNPFS